MLNRNILVMITAGLMSISAPAFASKASKAVSQCRDAVVQEQGQDAVAKLRKVQSRGAGFDVWLNVTGIDNELRAFCYLKKGEVQQMVTEEGRWTSRHPSRPDFVKKSAQAALTSGNKIS